MEKDSKEKAYFIESNIDYAVIRNKENNEIIRHATEYEEDLYWRLEASEKRVEILEEQIVILRDKNKYLANDKLELEEELKRKDELIEKAYREGYSKGFDIGDREIWNAVKRDYSLEYFKKENNL